ncbi:MAG: ABC transporter permease [Proteobacteria bacterium]|nr:ABC transporter permease [Pseudomonadota bacterium]
MFRRPLIDLFLRRNLTLTLVIAASAGALSLFLALLFPETDPAQSAAAYANWPPVMKDLFGDPAGALSDVYGWLNLQVFHITFWVMYGVLGSILATRIVAKEMEEKSVDILLSLPVSRTEIIASRMVAASILIALSIPPVILGCGLGVAVLGQPLHAGLITAAAVNGLALVLVMTSLTLLVSVFLPGQTTSLFTSLGLFAVMFLFSRVVIKLVPLLGPFAVLSPFHYYAPDGILVQRAINALDPLVLLTIAASLFFTALLVFKRKDILT